uniref:PP28 domain-containing protein n=1 Tax=Trichuris muris TaxID=70415 RepID=A0A5S6QMW4_TRIMR
MLSTCQFCKLWFLVLVPVRQKFKCNCSVSQMSKPRGGKKKFGHKGGSRHFTSFDELKAQQDEVEKARHRDEEDERAGRDAAQELRIQNFDKPRKAPDANKSGGSSSESEESSDSEDEDTGKHKGIQHLIEIENPNRRAVKNKKVTDVNVHKGPAEMSRREREAVEKERARQHYLALHAAGKTEEARADLARLALIRKQREEAAKKRQEEHDAKEARKAKGQA